MNMVNNLKVELQNEYAFSNNKYVGEKHLFFWLLTNRMAPPAVFLLPFFQLYSSVGLFDTHIAVALAHCLFTVPLAVWILEGFISGVPREVDETAFIDGYSFSRFFIRIFLPMISSGIGVTAFFCFMFSWVEVVFARILTVTNGKPISMAISSLFSFQTDIGLVMAMSLVSIIPGAILMFFMRNHLSKGFMVGAGR